MRRGRQRKLLVIVAVALAGLLPPLAFLIISYYQTMSEAHDRLQKYAELSIERGDKIFDNAEATLTAMTSQLEPRCTPATVEGMRKVAHDSLYFHEAGLVSDDAVLCTSETVYNPPLHIRNLQHGLLPESGMHITPAARTMSGSNAIVIYFRASRDNAFDVLLNPVLLDEPFRELFTDEHATVQLQRSDGMTLAKADTEQEISGDTTDHNTVVVNSKRYPIRAVARASAAAMHQHWRTNALIYGSVGLLMSAILFVMLLYLARRHLTEGATLQDAFDDGQIHVFYQPVFDGPTGICVGAEALMRWQHPQLGMILPGTFIPTAEESGFIVHLTEWLMERVVLDMGPLANAYPDFHIALNLSPAHVLDPSLVRSIREIFDVRMSADRVIFEITENQLIAGHDGPALEILRKIHDFGARIALDDFGTGYSSLKYLSQFPFDYLKIDKAFIDGIGNETVNAGLVDTIVTMAKQLKLRTIAEGVETEVQLTHLRKLGVDFVQGWLFSKALPFDEFQQFVHANRKARQRVTALKRPFAVS